uniref:Uncharacterized protein n=1 Tax=Wuchereria bancrofti TaxID=6293 RepID=A0A1I8F0R6_WUCBA
AYRPDSTIYQNYYCCCCADHSQNLITTFQCQPNDVWQTRNLYYEEEVIIVLSDNVERIGFSISNIKRGATINSISSDNLKSQNLCDQGSERDIIKI